MVAADAGLMQIELWGETVLRCATAALWSMTFHSTDREMATVKPCCENCR